MRKPGRILFEVLAHVLKKPATANYPAVKTPKPDKFRGKLVFDASKCIGCKICMKDCPSNAITINKVAEKQFEAVVDLDKCIYCAQCVDSCPKKALAASKEFELASLDRRKLKVRINAETKPEDDTKGKP
jgi:formate hydrogenlyase subunit 6/NADH:ubiquinone oxidoreductase subunit I